VSAAVIAGCHVTPCSSNSLQFGLGESDYRYK